MFFLHVKFSSERLFIVEYLLVGLFSPMQTGLSKVLVAKAWNQLDSIVVLILQVDSRC